MNTHTAPEQLKQNLLAIEDEIAHFAARAGRQPNDVCLVAVSKYVEYPVCKALVEQGAKVLGESRPQLLASKAKAALEDGLCVKWHQIGHLQTNKVRDVLPYTELIHSVDSIRLLDAISETLEKRFPEKPYQDVLLEVNYEQEENKTGLAPDALIGVMEYALTQPRIRVRGLMTMGALGSSPEEARKTFAAVRQLRDKLQETYKPETPLTELSMGMSHDFHEAILEGATMVRVGSRLFE